MAKVFPLFLVVLVLAVSVLFFSIPTQEQPVNAYTNGDTDLMQYQLGDYTCFINIPSIIDGGNGYKFQFDVNGVLPFEYCFIKLDNGRILEISFEYFSGVLSLQSPSYDFNFNIEYSTLMPFRLELVVCQYYRNIRLFVIINTEYIGYYYVDLGVNFNFWSITFEREVNGYFEPYLYSYWDSPSSSKLAVNYSKATYNIPFYQRSWVDGGAGYDAGYIDGANSANTAVLNVLPAFIGSIFAFFVSIASYEVLGISLLNIMIIAGSVLLLLAVLRVFLK